MSGTSAALNFYRESDFAVCVILYSDGDPDGESGFLKQFDRFLQHLDSTRTSTRQLDAPELLAAQFIAWRSKGDTRPLMKVCGRFDGAGSVDDFEPDYRYTIRCGAHRDQPPTVRMIVPALVEVDRANAAPPADADD